MLHKGYKQTPEHRANISAAMKGKKHTPEHCAKIAASLRGHEVSPEARAKLSAAHRGHKHTPESRAKISAAMTPERREKIGAAHRGIKRSPEIRSKISAATQGSKNPRWKGGRYIETAGYVRVYRPGHPFATAKGYVMEHRLIVEKAIGRYLKPSEKVHHDNEKKDDNRNKNLVACQDEKYHQLLHRRAKALAAASAVGGRHDRKTECLS